VTWILLVTWLAPKQPPVSYQTQFSSQQACAAARDQVLNSAQAMRQQMISDAPGMNPAFLLLPYVSAVCSQQ
jgi:hypothetical protein